jgi:hypothetical protein
MAKFKFKVSDVVVQKNSPNEKWLITHIAVKIKDQKPYGYGVTSFENKYRCGTIYFESEMHFKLLYFNFNELWNNLNA